MRGVGGFFGGGVGEIDGDREAAEKRQREADACAGVGADGADGDVAFNIADVEEDNAAEELLVNWEIDLGGGHEIEVAADGVFKGAGARGNAAEAEPA